MNLAKHLRPLFLVIAAILGALDSWTARNALNPMGVSYLDMGDAFFRGDWNTALNGFWSPLYSLPLGLATHLFNPSARFEYPLVHIVNYVIYLCALIAFDFFLKELIRLQKERTVPQFEENIAPLPEWALQGLGYILFLWTSLGLITLVTTAPDMLVAVFVYLAFGLVLRIRRRNRFQDFIVLGVVLGFGYLAKAPMLPLSILFLLAAWFCSADRRKAAPRVAASALCFVLVAGPFVLALSHSKGRLIFGDSGKLNYLWHVNKIPVFHWQGGEPRYGTLAHPTRKIFENPSIYEFGTPLNATYAPWYDPSYWYEGAVPRFELKQQKAALKSTTRIYLEIFLYRSHLILLLGFLYLFYCAGHQRFQGLSKDFALMVPSIAALAIFLPVHVEARYVAPFICALWLFLFSLLRFPARATAAQKPHAEASARQPRWGVSKKLVTYVIVAVISLVTLAAVLRSTGAFYASLRETLRNGEPSPQIQVAEALKRKDIKPGEGVGLINFEQRWLPVVHWARLARVRVVAELPNRDSDAFASADDSRRKEVIQTFAKVGARALVAAHVPEGVALPGWERVGETNYYVMKLDQP